MLGPKLRIVLSVLVVGALSLVIALILVNRKPSASVANDACPKLGANYTLAIANNMFQPQDLTVRRCDRIMVINTDDTVRHIALGAHDHHLHYQGFTETKLTKDQQYTFTATTVGTYEIHDHFHDETEGTLTIR